MKWWEAAWVVGRSIGDIIATTRRSRSRAEARNSWRTLRVWVEEDDTPLEDRVRRVIYNEGERREP